MYIQINRNKVHISYGYKKHRKQRRDIKKNNFETKDDLVTTERVHTLILKSVRVEHDTHE